MQTYNKSPLNYIGGKYKILPQILEYFPQSIDNFIDLFAGGLDVATNVNSKKTLDYIDDRIEEFNLSKSNEEAYKKFRAYYNKTKKLLDLYILVCYSFNYQFRFNNKHEFNRRVRELA